MSFAILGIGTALPSHSVEQGQAAEAAARAFCRTEEQAAAVESLFRHAGVAKRHTVVPQGVFVDVCQGTASSQSVFLPAGGPDDRGPTTQERLAFFNQEAPQLACRAGAEALAKSGLAPCDITHVVTVSCTGFAAPGIDVRLIKGLRLRATVERTQIGFMGCHGALNGLRVAQAFAAGSPEARILLCATELCSVHYHYGWDLKKLAANALFADGAAAVVGAPLERAPAGSWHVAATGSCLIPDTEGAMTWNIGDHGFEMTLWTRVPRLIAQHLGPWLEAWLDSYGVRLAEVGSWAVHPGGPRILEAVEEALGLDGRATAASREVLAEFGNMSSPTVLFILERLRERSAPRPCVALGFGPGLVVEAVLWS